ncbi:MAG: sigma 54-interacting transcriptional regulator [Clostridiales Family XIII bacterium]|jgi:transcriptional regulator of acetoin/glycerol metabolism|nr:sigma 54-interacting transcriptional regulator [Clostridiales Family XIII bacterium]
MDERTHSGGAFGAPSDPGRILHLWKTYVAGAAPFPGTAPEGIRPEIFESWRRGKAAGISPFTTDTSLTEAGILLAGAPQNRRLISAAHSYLENLYTFVRGSDFLIALTERSGIVIDLIGLEGMIEERAKRSALKIGCSRSESVAGTCGIGTCLTLGEPIQIWGAEHYIEPHHGYVCSAAPIHDEGSALIGCIACIGPSEGVTKHTLGMVCAAADGIEKALKMRRANDELRIANSKLATTLDALSQGIIMVGKGGFITQSNNSAAGILRLPGVPLTGANIRSLLDFTAESEGILAIDKNVSHRELDVTNKKGILLNLSVSASVLRGENGEKVSTVLILEERRQFNKVATKVGGFTARYSFDQIIGGSGQIAEIKALGALAAQSDSNVLIIGESGTGKDLLAQSIHNAGARRGAPFVAVNCGAISRNLVESELFGYEAGAFTGAGAGGAPGKFELADGGTLFLDEIGDMPIEMQATLLRAIQSGEILRVGASAPRRVNVRIIAATNVNLAELIESRRFRKDLFYRLNVLTFRMPALRERMEDMPTLVAEFIAMYNEKMGTNVKGFTQGAMGYILAYGWPGNIRELENVIERAMNLTSADTLTEQDLGPELLRAHITAAGIPSFAAATAALPGDAPDPASTGAGEERLIRDALIETRGNVTKAARLAGIPKRTLYRRIGQLGINLTGFRA